MNRGEIWLINLDPTLGAEIQKTRPAVIISSDAVGILPLRIVVPLTDWKERYQSAEWMVYVAPDAGNHLAKPSAADTFQVRSVSTTRFVRQIGTLAEVDLKAITQAVALVIEYTAPE
jgi:mRNA interferase MazF